MSPRQRGPHPDDAADFAPSQLAALRRAAGELSWLLSRAYSPTAALTLVGDHHQLTRRQRYAVRQAAIPEATVEARRQRRLEASDLSDRIVRVDGFNCVITLEAALSGAPIVVGRDGVSRDLSRLRGSYRQVATTRAAIAHLGEVLADAHVANVEWCLDRPVSNSGRLRATILDVAAERRWAWTVELTDATDRAVADAHDLAASTDGWILDHARCWFDLAGAAIARAEPDAWRVDLRPDRGR